MFHQHSAPAAAAGDLLDAYRPGDAFLAAPSGAILGQGTVATAQRLEDVGDLLARGTADSPAGPVAIGAIPFDTASPGRLVVPATVRTAPPLAECGLSGRVQRPLPGPWDRLPVPEPAEHAAGVERVRTLLARGAGDHGPAKIVLARSLRLRGPGPVDVGRLLGNLAWRDPGAYTFAADLPAAASAPRTLVGASPELLVAKRGGRAFSNPLAGSAPRSADPDQDRFSAAELLRSAKDRHEHAVVVEAVTEALRPYCRTLEVPEPELARTPTLWHLSTSVTGELRDPETPSPVLAAALHPTPAVCGTPTGAARAAIAETEPFDRGFYTGAVGYTDARGDGEWIVSIRCADVAGDTLGLFAGGGIVGDSDPDAELAETSAKLRTLLLALGVEPPDAGPQH
ncbi:isochorismate synthase [Streptomonospora salina]|uniref:isochorismate synthase n=1 Tax=Streptomonospora salina TaxID=104205 RepID=A0A841EK84_9ACTN|nr:isochorismate synthase [Streptomonospora salina]MBB6001188.1 isochorismate synthase [Streptomonospora salina]